MTGTPLLWLALIFVVTSAISVFTGSTSLITAPAMLQFHIEPRTALATSMFALTFMSVGGAFPFLRGQAVDRGRLPLLTALTLAGSAMGAFLLLLIPTHSVTIIVSAAMIGVAIVLLIYRKSGMQDGSLAPSAQAEFLGYVLTFLLGIYGGFFSAFHRARPGRGLRRQCMVVGPVGQAVVSMCRTPKWAAAQSSK
jgi:uncharacterized membrane protein YfcA